ncbi:MAG: hypothetical protein GX221_05955 [Candidatus Riflebacteria bacterium]|nr:hypothetical protein [Candidatus Riflebacteria bacterium]
MIRTAVIVFAIVAILGFVYADRVFYFQAGMMRRFGYVIAEYEALERLVRYFPESPLSYKALNRMENLMATSGDVRAFVEKGSAKNAPAIKKRADLDSYH